MTGLMLLSGYPAEAQHLPLAAGAPPAGGADLGAAQATGPTPPPSAAVPMPIPLTGVTVLPLAPDPAPSAAPGFPAPRITPPAPVELTNLDGDQGLRLIFDGASARLPLEGEARLKAVVPRLAAGKTRIQIRAYAGSSTAPLSSARRLSLSRALMVRSFLVAQGIRGTLIDVRAMGIARDGGPVQRVDVIVLGR